MEALKNLKEWDDLEVVRPLSSREREMKMEAIEDFKHWALIEEMSWR